MPIAPSRFVPYEAKTIVIRIYSYEDKNIAGALHNTGVKGGRSFSNLTQMLLGIERILDDNNFPQPNLEARSFSRATNPAGDEDRELSLAEETVKKTPIATFKLNVMFRRNASWQGSLAWMEDGSEVQFRSVLELVQLLDSVF